jgi:hypothetical protein
MPGPCDRWAADAALPTTTYHDHSRIDGSGGST